MRKKKTSKLIFSGRRMKSGKANLEFRTKPVLLGTPEVKENPAETLVNKLPLL